MPRLSPVIAALLMACVTSAVHAQVVVTPKPMPAAVAENPAVLAEIPLKRVVLFASGVGFFEHRGSVDGNASMTLRFKTEQINDILKSLVIADPAGSAKVVGYPSLDPLTKTLRSFQIDLSQNPSVAGIFEQIRGAAVTVRVGDDVLNGNVLGTELRQRPMGGGDNAKPINVTYVNLRTSGGIRSVSVDEIRSFEIEDEVLRRELNQALAAITAGRDKDKKPVVIDFAGKGPREVNVGYVVETPIWKTSYRLTLPERKADGKSDTKGAIQGWAIVENQTDNDWQNVSVDLVGGRPLSFVEDLYNPYYVPRPVSRPTLAYNIAPQVYGGDMLLRRNSEMQANSFNKDRSLVAAKLGAVQQNQMMAKSAPMADAVQVANGNVGFVDGAAEAIPAYGVNAVADGAQLGEMFQYSVKNVTLARQRSAMLPIVSDGVEVQRYTIFNQSVTPRRGLLGARVRNITGKYLLGGPVTVFDSTPAGQIYAGDAKIEDMPNGQSRLLSFGMDQDLLFDVKADNDGSIMTATVVKGVLNVQRKTVVTRDYVVDNKSDRDKNVVIEEPIMGGYDLKLPEKYDTKTDKVYRLVIASPAGKQAKLSVKQEHVEWQGFSVLPMDVDSVVAYSKQGEIPGKVRDALKKVAEKKYALIEIQRQQQFAADLRKRQMEELGQIRDNIRVLPGGSKSQQDQITHLTEKDNDLRATIQKQQDLQTQADKAQGELDDYVSGLNLE